MPQYDNTNRGALFKNERKSSPKHPDYTGKLDVNGEEFRLSAWIRESKDGKKFMSISVTDPSERGGARVKDDEDIPF